MDDQDPRVIKNLDNWANRIVDKVLDRELISIPDTVIALACIRMLAKVTNRSSVLTEAAALRILDKEFSEIEKHKTNERKN